MSKIIANNLNKIRLKYSLKQVELAKIMGISRSILSKTLKGERGIKWEEMARLRLKLNIDLNALVLDDYNIAKIYTPNILNSQLINVFEDLVKYNIELEELVKPILRNIFCIYLSEKSILGKIQQTNRIISDFAVILFNLKTDKVVIRKENAKKILIDKIKKSRIKFFGKSVKRAILKRVELLSEKDCYYIIKNNKLASAILLDFMSNYDKKIFLRAKRYKEIIQEKSFKC